MKEQKVHQTYGPGAARTACGLNLWTTQVATARPGPKVTCKTCNRVESVRLTEAKARKAKLTN